MPNSCATGCDRHVWVGFQPGQGAYNYYKAENRIFPLLPVQSISQGERNQPSILTEDDLTELKPPMY